MHTNFSMYDEFAHYFNSFKVPRRTVPVLHASAYFNFILFFTIYRHILVQPQTYHLGVTETISFTSYGSRKFEVVAQVLYTECQCVTTSNGPSTVCSDIYREFSSSRATSTTGTQTAIEKA